LAKLAAGRCGIVPDKNLIAATVPISFFFYFHLLDNLRRESKARNQRPLMKFAIFCKISLHAEFSRSKSTGHRPPSP
jgi:hypothetical protein